MTTGEKLGERLYELRKGKGLSQEALANKLCVSRQAVSKWELGESLPDTENLIAISLLFDTSLDDLVGLSSERSSKPKKDAPKEEEKSDSDSLDDGLSDIYSKRERTRSVAKRVICALPFSVIALIAFLLWGFILDEWYVSWTFFLTVPVLDSITDCIKYKKVSEFAYTVLTAFIYLFIGMKWGLWHPYWVIFITVPIFYEIADAIDK